MKRREFVTVMVAVTLFALSALAAAAQETLMWSFNVTDGNGPQSELLPDGKGNLFGTTVAGGTDSHGTVFELSPSVTATGDWSEKVIYSFGENGSADGQYPQYAMVFDSKGDLYGVVSEGGATKSGGIFELTPSGNDKWTEKMIYNFYNSGDKAFDPNGGLVVDKDGNLYGVLYGGGGTNNGGQVYKLSPGGDGKWTSGVVYDFKGSSTGDGAQPQGTLAWDRDGNLYGTTLLGGTLETSYGTVFELSPAAGGTWSEKVLYSFKGSPDDGARPVGSLTVDADGNLYGATGNGGTDDVGTVYELVPSSGEWTDRILHSFVRNTSGPGDGEFPVAGPVFDPVGNLYGVTTGGGGTGNYGTVIRLKPTAGDDWDESVVHRFGVHNGDGNEPMAGLLVDADGNLYGTTTDGGEFDDGAAFEIFSPSAAPAPVFSHPAGTYKAAIKVAIKDSASGAKIYFTTTGKIPTDKSRVYSEPIEVRDDETVNAIAIADGYTPSKVAAATYAVRAATPEFSVAAGKYAKAQSVKISDTTADTVIYFTTDGATPTTASKKYRYPIKVTSSETIKAFAVAANFAQSAVASAAYTIEKSAARAADPSGIQ
jgi:uncharacterized repeat protein (TIGR03803 family)